MKKQNLVSVVSLRKEMKEVKGTVCACLSILYKTYGECKEMKKIAKYVPYKKAVEFKQNIYTEMGIGENVPFERKGVKGWYVRRCSVDICLRWLCKYINENFEK